MLYVVIAESPWLKSFKPQIGLLVEAMTMSVVCNYWLLPSMGEVLGLIPRHLIFFFKQLADTPSQPGITI